MLHSELTEKKQKSVRRNLKKKEEKRLSGSRRRSIREKKILSVIWNQIFHSRKRKLEMQQETAGLNVNFVERLRWKVSLTLMAEQGTLI